MSHVDEVAENTPKDIKLPFAFQVMLYIGIIGMAIFGCTTAILLFFNFQWEQRAKRAEHTCNHVNSLVVLPEEPGYQGTRSKKQPEELARLLEQKHVETDAYNKKNGTNLRLQLIFVPLEPPSPEAQ